MAVDKKVLLIPDIHVPWQDDSALRIVRAFARDWKPDVRVCMGDLINVDQVSKFTNDETVALQEEFDQGNEVLDKLGFGPGDVMLEGNHEERLRRPSLVKEALREVLSPKRHLHIDKRGMKWKPYDNKRGIVRFGKLTVLHGFWYNEYAARKHAEAYGCCVFGHTHRHQVFQPKQAFESQTGFNIGCLCQLDMPWQKTKGPNGWTQGFGFAYVFKNGHFSLYDVRMIGNRFVIENKEYSR